MTKKNSRKRGKIIKKIKRIGGRVVLLVFLLAFAAAAIYGFRTAETAGSAYSTARELKSSLKAFAVSMESLDTGSAQQQLDEIHLLSSQLREYLESSEMQFAGKLPFISRQYDSAMTLLDVLDEGCAEILQPMLTLVRTQPLSSIRTDSTAALNYIAFAADAYTEAESLLARTEGLDLSLIDRSGRISALLDTASAVCDSAGDDVTPLLEAASDLLTAYPVSGLKTDAGFSVNTITAYLDFAEEYMPQIEALISRVSAQLPGSITQNEIFQEYFGKIQSLIRLYDENGDLIELARVVLGSGEDRYYLVPALNASELRAVGGFPGSVGSIEIHDGSLNIGKFQPVHDMIPGYFPSSVEVPWSELNFFYFPLSNPQLVQDACCCPDFSWVAPLWAAAHEERVGDTVDGVIAMTPVIIQRLLSITGPITLSDGTVLDGTNATRAIEYDIYFKYYQKGTSASADNAEADSLFSETAAKAMSSLLSSFGISHVAQYVQIAKESLDDRTIQVWMKDEDEQSVVRSLGWSGEPDADPETAEAGVYFNCTDASRMGWFAELNVAVSDPVVNGDGSKSYTVTVDVTDIITKEEISVSGDSILGGAGGNINYQLYLSAPAGAVITDVEQPMGFHTDAEYRGLNMVSVKNLYAVPGGTTTITFLLTTAAGSDLPLTIRTTNTLQEYHTTE